MTIVVAIVVAIVTGVVVAAVVVAAMRRHAQAAHDPAADLRAIQHDLGNLMGRLDSGFAQASRDHGTVRSTLAMLTHDGGRRGTWGEVTLRRLLERAGLAHRVDFDTQVTLKGGRPDAVIDLGSAGKAVVDAKAPLADLARAWEAETAPERDAALKAHATVVRRHARDLADREYGDLLDTPFAPVVMYLPVDGAWEAAVDALPDLPAELLAMQVHPASPSTLGLVLAVLKQHALTVDHEASVRRVLEDTRSLLGRLSTHADHLDRMGRALSTATDAYNQARGNYVSRVLPAAGRMAEHIGDTEPTEPGSVLAVVRSDPLPRLDTDRVA